MNKELAQVDDFDQSIKDWYVEEFAHTWTEEDKQNIIDSIKVPEIGKVFESTIVGEDSDDFLLDCGFKDWVRVAKIREERNLFKNHKTGDVINVLIISVTESIEFSINGSVASIYKAEAFEILKNIEDDEFVNVLVNKLTPAGYDCTIIVNDCEIRAFLPQILAGVNRIHENAKSDLVGETFNMCIESFANDKGTWIVSRRKYLKQLIPSYIQELDKDSVYQGHVTGTTEFGVFVEFFDCLTGMIHKTNLTEEMKDSFIDIKPGDSIEFYVKEILRKNKLILTQVQMESIWDTINIGDKLKGVIKDHKAFGTLIRLDHETLGLIHISEQTDNIKTMESGDKISVKVLAIERDKRKIYLSAK